MYALIKRQNNFGKFSHFCFFLYFFLYFFLLYSNVEKLFIYLFIYLFETYLSLLHVELPFEWRVRVKGERENPLLPRLLGSH